MSTWQTPKEDWNTEDYMNIGDLDRIEGNMQYLADEVATFSTVSVTTASFMVQDFFYVGDANRVEANLENLKDVLGTPAGWQSTVTWVANNTPDYREFQRWESNEIRLFNLIQLFKDAFRNCGGFQVICGRGNSQL